MLNFTNNMVTLFGLTFFTRDLHSLIPKYTLTEKLPFGVHKPLYLLMFPNLNKDGDRSRSNSSKPWQIMTHCDFYYMTIAFGGVFIYKPHLDHIMEKYEWPLFVQGWSREMRRADRHVYPDERTAIRVFHKFHPHWRRELRLPFWRSWKFLGSTLKSMELG